MVLYGKLNFCYNYVGYHSDYKQKDVRVLFSNSLYHSYGFGCRSSVVLCVHKKIKLIDKKLLSISIPTGIINALAAITQKIGLQYTTPTKCAVLDTLSCLAVPIMLLILTKKMPNVWKFVAALLCISGCFVLTGVSFDDFSAFGIGEILCATAGILYGVNIALTGVFAKDICVPLHVTIHMGVQVVTGTAVAIAFNFIEIGDRPIEEFRISFEILPIIILIFMGLIGHRLEAKWTFPMFFTAGIFIMSFYPEKIKLESQRIFAVLCTIFIVIFLAGTFISHHCRTKKGYHLDMAKVRVIADRFHYEQTGKPVSFITGTLWESTMLLDAYKFKVKSAPSFDPVLMGLHLDLLNEKGGLAIAEKPEKIDAELEKYVDTKLRWHRHEIKFSSRFGKTKEFDFYLAIIPPGALKKTAAGK